MKLRVWAPASTTVEYLIGSERHELSRSGEYWLAEIPAGAQYLLSLDGGPGYPDPRSRFQPEGVHGPSQAVCLDFPWTDTNWAPGSCLDKVWYELHVGTFTPEGTLDSAVTRLPHLAGLGVQVVELMPVAAFEGERGWGYDGVGLFAVHRAYGGPRALQRFVDAAHRHGIAVALDVVYNHLGPSGNYLQKFGPYFTSAHSTPWGDALNLDDAGAHGVREFVIDNARYWFERFHVDALRLDAVHALIDDSEHHILAELAEASTLWQERAGRTLTLVAESDLNDVRMITPTEEGGFGMDGQWADDVHHALHSYLSKETFGYYVDFGSPETLSKAFTNVFVHDGTYSTFRSTMWGRPVPDHIDRSRFVVFSQNHDQVGNRGLGDRPDERLPRGTVMAGAALLLLGPFTPMLFQGQEWGTSGRFQYFSDHEGELAHAITEGRKAEFARHGWNEIYGEGFAPPGPQDIRTFEESSLDWSECARHAEILNAHRTLIALRERIRGDPFAAAQYGEGWFRLVRSELEVIIHPHEGSSTHHLDSGEIVWAWGLSTRDDDMLTIGPHAVVVIQKPVSLGRG